MKFGVYFFLQAPPSRSQADVILDEVDQMVLADKVRRSMQLFAEEVIHAFRTTQNRLPVASGA